MIKINERFYINASNNCYTLQEKTTIQDETSKNYGQEIFRDLGYYTTLESCIKGILKTTIREFIGKETQNDLKDLIEFIKNENKFLDNLKLDI